MKIFDINLIMKEKKCFQKEDMIGVYFLFKNEEIVYIGQTINGMARILSHVDKDFDSYSFIKTKKQNLFYTEGINILYHKPKLNKGIFSYKDRSVKEINNLCKMIFKKKNIKQLQKIISIKDIPFYFKDKKTFIPKEYIIYTLIEFIKYEQNLQ